MDERARVGITCQWAGRSAPREEPTLSPGDTSDRLAALRDRLQAEDVGAQPVADTAAVYDAATAVAVAQFQPRHGLAVDSAVGPRTLAALNVTAAERALQIEANLERYRWLPPDLGDRYIVVNIAAFRLRRTTAARACSRCRWC